MSLEIRQLCDEFLACDEAVRNCNTAEGAALQCRVVSAAFAEFAEEFLNRSLRSLDSEAASILAWSISYQHGLDHDVARDARLRSVYFIRVAGKPKFCDEEACEHCVVEVEGHVIDWTMRQFNPESEFPTIYRSFDAWIDQWDCIEPLQRHAV